MGKRSARIPFAAALVLLVFMEIVGRVVRVEGEWFPMAETVLTRLVGALVFLPLIRRMGYPVLGGMKKPLSRFALPILITAWVVALNNLPAVGLLSGNARVTAGWPLILLFALECAAVGCFEELAFRGFLLPYCAEAMKGRKRAAFLPALVSSAVFGAVHLVNLFSGASPGAVAMQIGYSFLIGGLCAAVLLASGSVWMCAAVHAVYNFCGTILSRFGEGIRWDPVTILLTVGIGLAASVFILFYLLRADGDLDHILPNNGQPPESS